MNFLSNRKDIFKPGDFVYRIKDTERYGLGVVYDAKFPEGVTDCIGVHWEYPSMNKANALAQSEFIKNLVHANITCVKKCGCIEPKILISCKCMECKKLYKNMTEKDLVKMKLKYSNDKWRNLIGVNIVKEERLCRKPTYGFLTLYDNDDKLVFRGRIDNIEKFMRA